MSAHLMPKVGIKFTLVVSQGPDAGAVFQLIPPSVTIGRGGENHVILTDPRVSRQGAMIEFDVDQIVITNLSPKVHLFVNGYPIEKAQLNNGDIILLGSTEMQFNVEALALAPHQPSPMAQPRSSATARPSPLTGRRPPNRMFLIVVGVLVIGAIYISMETEKKPGRKVKLTTPADIEAEMKKSQAIQEAQDQKRVFRTEEERTKYNEANKHFLEGFRDFQKGQFVRAIRSFETARIIDPNHALAVRYHRMADKARDELIAKMTLEGKRYREKSMFKRCSAAFEKVLDEIPNRNDLRYKEAEQFKRECDSRVESKFE